MSNLGRLEKADLRDIWQNEAGDFTPWLAREDNIALLGDTLGLDLELEAQERSVGPFRADILCKDTANGSWVLIENQLEQTDHTHLGQLLTYAAGLDAVTIVWIAARFRDEHRAALDWLNNETGENIRFFGLEVELWKIASSPIAPKFNMVAKPNDWSKSVKSGLGDDDLSRAQALQLEYWGDVEELIRQRGQPIKPVAPQAQSWVSHGIGRSGVSLSLSMNTRDHWIQVSISLTGPFAKSHFAALSEARNAIETKIGTALEWHSRPDKKEARIFLVLNNADPFDEKDRPRQYEWLVNTAVTFYKTFRPYILKLPRKKSGQNSEIST